MTYEGMQSANSPGFSALSCGFLAVFYQEVYTRFNAHMCGKDAMAFVLKYSFSRACSVETSPPLSPWDLTGEEKGATLQSGRTDSVPEAGTRPTVKPTESMCAARP
jgi:hypothetical protein